MAYKSNGLTGLTLYAPHAHISTIIHENDKHWMIFFRDNSVVFRRWCARTVHYSDYLASFRFEITADIKTQANMHDMDKKGWQCIYVR